MAQIVERIFTYVSARGLSLGGEQWSRKIALGNQWSRIRCGVLCSIKGAVTTQGYFRFGFSNGQLGGGSAVGNNAIGAELSGTLSSGTGTWTYNSNSGYPYYSSGANGKVFRRYPKYPGAFGPSQIAESAGTISTVNIAAMPDPTVSANLALRRTPVIFDISREGGGAGTATVLVYGVPNTAIAFDYRPDHMLEAIDNTGTPTIFGTALTVLLNSTIPVSDMLGGLDSFFVHWARAATPLEIYAMGASVIRQLYWGESPNGAGADVFSAYNFTGTGLPSVLSAGSGFSTQISFGGSYTNPGVISGWSGTCGTPLDTLDQYSNGSVVSNVTLNAGTGWTGNGLIS
jgi:hypothetical protein